jgi:hypothetical protein
MPQSEDAKKVRRRIEDFLRKCPEKIVYLTAEFLSRISGIDFTG